MLFALLGVNGCFDLEPEAEFEITDWEQSYYEISREYSSVKVYYRIQNTGPVNIDYYQVWIEVKTEDGSAFQEWTNGLDVAKGKYATDYTYIDVSGKKASSVSITDYELKTY